MHNFLKIDFHELFEDFHMQALSSHVREFSCFFPLDAAALVNDFSDDRFCMNSLLHGHSDPVFYCFFLKISALI